MKNSIAFLLLVVGTLSFIQCHQNTGEQGINSNIAQDTMSTSEIKQKQEALKNRALSTFLTKLEFKYTGELSGIETAYIGDSGKTVVVYKKLSRNDTQQHTTVIWKDGLATHIDHNKEEVRTNALRPKDTDLTLVNIDNPAIEGYERGEDEVILERPCVKYFNKITQVEVLRWRLIDLKYDALKSPTNLKYLKEITNIEEGVEIPATVLEIPVDYVKK